MPAAIVPIDGQRAGVWVLLQAELPGRGSRNIGVFLMDSGSGRGWLRLRDHFDGIADAEDAEVLQALEEDARARIAAVGAEAWLASLEDSLSNTLRVSERQAIGVDAFSRALDRLYGEHVEEIAVRPFETHLPLFTLRAAAGSLGEEMAAEPEDWVRAPEGMRLGKDLFAAHVVGRSMEPRIPDGSVNLFRLHPAGSRQGKILLVERFGSFDETARYTIKRYTSVKKQFDDGQWEHERIRLEPLNPEFEAWDVDPADFAVVAEWLRVLE
jgi:phage repressor protein C with HTH and peptisase S24 domain